MDGNTDGPGLVRNRACNRLTYPPCGIGAELVAALVFKLIHGLHQTDIALLNQVQELQAAVRIFFGDAHDESEIGLDKFGLPALDLFFRHIQVLDRILDFFAGDQGLFRFQMSYVALRGLVDFLDIVQRVFRTARLSLEPRENPVGRGRASAAVRRPPRRGARYPLALGRSPVQPIGSIRHFPHALDHPVL